MRPSERGEGIDYKDQRVGTGKSFGGRTIDFGTHAGETIPGNSPPAGVEGEFVSFSDAKAGRGGNCEIGLCPTAKIIEDPDAGEGPVSPKKSLILLKTEILKISKLSCSNIRCM